jgi:phage terminase large subunit GpA-like protein
MTKVNDSSRQSQATVQRIKLAFFRNFRPPSDLSPSEWASDRVVIMDGLTPRYHVANAPWQREPLDVVSAPDVKEVVYLAPIGTGKTTFMEAGLCYIISEDPGPTLLVGQTDDDLKDWAETRMDYAVQNTSETAALLPKDRHKKRKMEILFPSMSLFLTGANLSGLQSKSMRRVFCDEAWQYRAGMLNEARGRLHDRWNRQFFILSQAGAKGDDLDKAWGNTDQREFSFDCPSCGTVQPWAWANVTYSDDESLDPLTRAQTAVLRCQNADCDWKCPDSPQPRRALAEGGRYVPSGSGLPGHVGFHYNVLCNWRKPLWEVVLLWLEAKAAMKVGNIDPLRQFIQKRLAEAWEEDLSDNRVELVGNGYLTGEFTAGQKIEDEAQRFLTVDKQRDHFWAGVRAWTASGKSMQLWYGRLETFDAVHDVAIRYGIRPQCVFVDAQYDTDQVYSACARMNWTALHGSGQKSFAFKKQNGDITHRPFTRFQDATASSGGKARYAHWASDRIKDILHAHRIGKAGSWDIPDDASSDFLKQIDSEMKREVTNSKTKQVEYRWVRTRNNNHAWDVESMQIVAALMLKLIPGFDV